MGVRLALGTTPGRLRSSLLWQGLFTVIAGTIPGIAGAMASGRFLESLDPAASYAVLERRSAQGQGSSGRIVYYR